MSEYTPITTDMRLLLGCFTKLTDFERDKFTQLCDVIDSIHAQLERENAALKAELDRVLGEQDEHTYSIGSATITVTPRLDWSAVAADLRELTALCERTKEEA